MVNTPNLPKPFADSRDYMRTFSGTFYSSKTYDHSIGLTCTFRQHRAESHCRFLHGYALRIELVFGAHELDNNGWAVDFGGLKNFKGLLEESFDHKLLVADDDPKLPELLALHAAGLAQVVQVPATGCEAFAAMIAGAASTWLKDAGFAPRCWVERVTVCEHGGNSATYIPGDDEGRARY